MIAIRRGEEADIPRLTEIWRRAVEATHGFLTPADINALEPEVREGLRHVELWVATDDEVAAGFMALDGDKIEALFVNADRFGKGFGTRLVDHVRKLRGANATIFVDVNEDNPSGRRFYQGRGFRQTGRSAVDSAGRPWPLLHLELPPDRS